jgi:hypothetical protein
MGVAPDMAGVLYCVMGVANVLSCVVVVTLVLS